MKIKTKLIIAFVAVTLLMLIPVLFVTHQTDTYLTTRDVEDKSTITLKLITAELNTRITDIQQTANGLKNYIESTDNLTIDAVKLIITNTLKDHDDIYGSTISFVPNSFSSDSPLVAPYYYKANDKFVYIDLAKPSYNYPAWDWFKTPVETGMPVWSEPYADTGGGNTVMVTYSVPFSKDGKIWGVATVDVALSKLTHIVDELNLGKEGYAFLISKNGTFLSLRRDEWKLKLTIFDAAKEFDNNKLKTLGEEMRAGQTGQTIFEDPLTGKKSRFVYGPVPFTDWSMAIVIPEEAFGAEIAKIRGITLVAIIGSLLVIILIITITSSSITKPIKELTEYAQRLILKDPAAKPPITKGQGDISILAESFIKLSKELGSTKEYMQDETNLFNNIISHLKEGVVITNPSYKIIEYNKTAEKLLSLPTDQSLVDHLNALFDIAPPMINIVSIKEVRKFTLKARPQTSHGNLTCTAIPQKDKASNISAIIFVLDLSK